MRRISTAYRVPARPVFDSPFARIIFVSEFVVKHYFNLFVGTGPSAEAVPMIHAAPNG